jgi:3-dehydroquinate synthase
MHTMTLSTPSASYEVVSGPGALAELPRRLAALEIRGALWLVCDAAVERAYAVPLAEALAGAGYRVRSHAVPSGEGSKSPDQLWALYDWLIGGGVERRDCVLALGGGVVGDLAGFAAASVLRGIGLVQLPTTLLAMVDSAIGGKTGINHALGKNLIGAFHQPRLVLADTETLRTLAPRELRSGWAEVIKHAVIRDAALFEDLEREADALARLEEPRTGEVIGRAAAVKVAVVGADERESGERMILNYGHTLGHAIEAASGYGTLLHGEAVAIGMMLAARIAQGMGLCDAGLVARQRALLARYGLPTKPPAELDPEQLLALTLRDKKVQASKVRWILPTRIGAVEIRSDVPEALVREVLEV